MRTRLSTLSTVLLAILFCLLSQQQARAQYVVISSSITYNANTNQVTGVSQTSMDYYTSIYYQAAVDGYLYQQGNSNPINAGSNASSPGYNSFASVTTQATGSPNKDYSVQGRHQIGTLYYDQSWNGVICGNYYRFNDVYRYYIYASSYNYGPSATFGYYGGGGACLTSAYIYFGTTNASLHTPSLTISMNNQRIGGNLNQTTQTALLGADVNLQATISPPGMTGGSYAWNVSGPYAISGGATNSSQVTIRSTNTGPSPMMPSLPFQATRSIRSRPSMRSQARAAWIRWSPRHLTRDSIRRWTSRLALAARQPPPIQLTGRASSYTNSMWTC